MHIIRLFHQIYITNKIKNNKRRNKNSTYSEIWPSAKKYVTAAEIDKKCVYWYLTWARFSYNKA